MTMGHDYSYERHIERRQELIRAARIEQLMRQAEGQRADFPRRLLLILSDAMIGGGVRLKRYARRASVRSLASADTHFQLVPKQ